MIGFPLLSYPWHNSGVFDCSCKCSPGSGLPRGMFLFWSHVSNIASMLGVVCVALAEGVGVSVPRNSMTYFDQPILVIVLRCTSCHLL